MDEFSPGPVCREERRGEGDLMELPSERLEGTNLTGLENASASQGCGAAQGGTGMKL